MVSSMTVLTLKKSILKGNQCFWSTIRIQRYDTYKYPVFEKLTQQQLSYFWRPEEISLQKIVEIIRLYAQNKTHFSSNLKYQIMLDSVQEEVLVWHLLRIVPYQNWRVV